MSKQKYFYVYKTTNIINACYYIGAHSTTNLEDGYLGSGKYLKNSIKKYGKTAFQREILEFFDCKEDMYIKERNLVTEELIKDILCMNLVAGGHGGWPTNSRPRGYKLTEKTKAKMRLRTGEKNAFYGKKHSEESREKMSEKGKLRTGQKNSFYGRYHSEETREKIKKARIKQIITEESKIKNSESHKGKLKSKETRQKMSESRKGMIGIHLDTNIKFINCTELEKYIKLGYSIGHK